jgi:hypothetical protein
MSDNITRPGSVRYKRDGEWIVTSPGDPLYSTALFCAEEALTDNGWEPMFGEDNGVKESN